jgi:hypothetical protein
MLGVGLLAGIELLPQQSERAVWQMGLSAQRWALGCEFEVRYSGVSAYGE